jgi:hypothetical protein
MKIHTLSPTQLKVMSVGRLDHYELCVYEAEDGDSWTGFIAGHAGWCGEGMPPSEPMPSFALALSTWVRRLKQLRLSDQSLKEQATSTSPTLRRPTPRESAQHPKGSAA